MQCFVGFFGLTRSLRHTANAIQECFLKPLAKAGFTPVCVGHFNLPEKITNPRSGEYEVVPDQAETALLDFDLCSVEAQDDAAIAAELEAVRAFKDGFDDDYASLTNLCHQLHSLERVWSLLEMLDVAEDDLVILLRPDLLYLDRLDPARHLAALLEKRVDLIVPAWQSWGGLNDRFAFCTGRAAKLYATRIRAFAETCQAWGGMHPESFLAHIIARHQLRVATTDLRGVRVRANGQIAGNDRAMLPVSAAPDSPARPPEPDLAVRREIVDGFARVSPLHGIPYLTFLEALHRRLQIRRYLEIGTQAGHSLQCATGCAVAIDPKFIFDKHAWATKSGMHLFEMTSDAFFSTNDPRDVLGGPVDLAFIDGMHLAEFVLRDFMNVERFCSKDGLIVLHDAVPQNCEMTERDRRPEARADKRLAAAWTGDVWRVVPLLQQERPDLCIEVLDCPPTGLVLVRRLDPQARRSTSELQRMVRTLESCNAPEAEFWSYIRSQPVLDSRKWLETLMESRDSISA